MGQLIGNSASFVTGLLLPIDGNTLTASGWKFISEF